MKQAYDEASWEKYRESLVSDEVAHLMYSKDVPQRESYSPLNFVNFQEYLQNCPDDDVEYYLELLKDDRNRSPIVFEQLGRGLYCNAHEYWEKLARNKVEAETPSARQLYEESGDD